MQPKSGALLLCQLGRDFSKSKSIFVVSASAEAFKQWHAEVLLSSKAFKLLHDRQSDPCIDNLSLVLLHESPQRDDEAARMMYVHWLKHKPGIVRQVHLDQTGGVIFSMAWAYPPLALQGPNSMRNTVILPDIGVPMLKVKSHERPRVCDEVRRLESILSNVIFQSLPEQDQMDQQ